MTPHIAPEIHARNPDFHLLSIVVTGAQVTTPNLRELESVVAKAEQAAQNDDPERDLHLAAWADAYRAFGARPNRTPCSATALLKRTRRQGLPRISPLVDAYNAVSVLYGLPIGGEDLDLYQGRPRLLVANGDEPFQTRKDGAEVTEHPDAGEIVWCDDVGVTCRRWNWRQGQRTLVSDETRSLWLLLEALGSMPPERLEAAGQDLTDLIGSLCPQSAIERLSLSAPGTATAA